MTIGSEIKKSTHHTCIDCNSCTTAFRVMSHLQSPSKVLRRFGKGPMIKKQDVFDGRGKASKAHRAYVLSALGGEHRFRVYTNLHRMHVFNLEGLQHLNNYNSRAMLLGTTLERQRILLAFHQSKTTPTNGPVGESSTCLVCGQHNPETRTVSHGPSLLSQSVQSIYSSQCARIRPVRS